jgi:hypothetical protein
LKFIFFPYNQRTKAIDQTLYLLVELFSTNNPSIVKREDAVKIKTVNRMLMTFAVSGALLVGTSIPADAQREQPKRNQDQHQSGQQQDKRQPRDEKQQDQQRQRSGQQENDKQREKQIEKQNKRMTRYENRLDRQVNVAERRQQELRQKSRQSHARFQEKYHARMLEQRQDLRNKYDHDLRNDPFFDAPPRYRYYRAGRYYHANQYVANVLRDAVDNGYEEGYLAGRADMEDGWRYGYKDCYAYEDATFGYTGYYVDLNEYRYYFREGFQRGYDDGYYNVYHYGRYEDGKRKILADILSRILYLMPLP